SETSRTSPRRPSLGTSSSRMIFIEVSLGRHVRQERYGARLFDRMREETLVPRAAARDASRDDLPPLGHEIPQAAHVLVIDQVDAVRAELADLAPAKAAALHGLLRCGNGSTLLSVAVYLVSTDGLD